MAPDYSLYLVTDSTQAVLGDKDLPTVVKSAIEGGVTIVQYRDKVSETKDLISMARRLHTITTEHSIPLLINDRVDVALAAGVEGVHLGQDDMDIVTARKLMGPHAIIGVTCSSSEEAYTAATDGADYLGIGTMFATPTKENTKSVIGPQGTKQILRELSSGGSEIATVAIGGINSSNLQRVLYQSCSERKGLDGVAVVSAIISARNPKAAARHLRGLLLEPPSYATRSPYQIKRVETLLEKVREVVLEMGKSSPLCHNMTNLVVQNFAANVALAIGASPIMANYGEEAEDLANLQGTLVINMGSVTPESIPKYLQAVRVYNACGGPVLFDPVGAGATKVRRAAVKAMMNGGYFDVIKGNENEITTVLGQQAQQQRGVDSGSSDTSPQEKARLVQTLAARERNVAIMTGATDYLSDGERTYAIHNGTPYLGKITGSGCTLGTTIAAFLAIPKGDKLLTALSGILVFEIAAQRASKRSDVKGPGTFVPAFLDELSEVMRRSIQNNWEWLAAANVEEMDI